MLFMPQDPEAAAAAAIVVEKVVAAEGRCRIAGWRDVPSDNAVVGRMAKAEQPIIRQVPTEPLRKIVCGSWTTEAMMTHCLLSLACGSTCSFMSRP